MKPSIDARYLSYNHSYNFHIGTRINLYRFELVRYDFESAGFRQGALCGEAFLFNLYKHV